MMKCSGNSSEDAMKIQVKIVSFYAMISLVYMMVLRRRSMGASMVPNLFKFV